MYQDFDLSGSNSAALTVTTAGSTSYNVQGNAVDYYWPYTHPYVPYVQPYVYVTWPTYPYYCTGEIHVFGCEHATKCKCGKASRKVESTRCGTCGK